MNQDKTPTERGHLAAISESRSDEFYKWVGHSITAWAKVEETEHLALPRGERRARVL
jgi:hypothetical protein